MELLTAPSSGHTALTRDPDRPTARPAVAGPHGPALTDELLVADTRAGLTPAQMVERKLASLLKRHSLPLSQMMTARRTSRSR
jgi:hypothetical protein